MARITLLELAQIAYQAYGASTGNKNFRGDPMPAWEDLPEAIQDAWVAAADGVRDTLSTRPSARG